MKLVSIVCIIIMLKKSRVSSFQATASARKYKNGLSLDLIKLLTLKTALFLHSKFWCYILIHTLFWWHTYILILSIVLSCFLRRKKLERQLPENHLCPKGTDRTTLCPHKSKPQEQELWDWGCLQELFHKSDRLSHIFCSPSLWLTALLPTCSLTFTITISCSHLPKVNFVGSAILICSLLWNETSSKMYWSKCSMPAVSTEGRIITWRDYTPKYPSVQICTLLTLWLQNLFFSELIQLKTYTEKGLMSICFLLF